LPNNNWKAIGMISKREDDKNMLDVNEHQMPYYPGTIMKIIKGRENVMSAANDERRHVLNPLVIWDGSIDRFKNFFK
jgi:hypothetical protein